METPNTSDANMRLLLESSKSMLHPDDDKALSDMVKAIRSGVSGIVIIGSPGDRIDYLFTSGDTFAAIQIMGEVIRAVARKLSGR